MAVAGAQEEGKCSTSEAGESQTDNAEPGRETDVFI